MKTRILTAAVAVALTAGMSDLRAGYPLAPPVPPVDVKVAGQNLPALLDLQLDTYRSAGDEHKFIVARDSAYRRAAAAGKAVDYDSFSLVRMATGNATQAMAGAVLADRMNLSCSTAVRWIPRAMLHANARRAVMASPERLAWRWCNSAARSAPSGTPR
jgi:hypothetical protein